MIVKEKNFTLVNASFIKSATLLQKRAKYLSAFALYEQAYNPAALLQIDANFSVDFKKHIAEGNIMIEAPAFLTHWCTIYPVLSAKFPVENSINIIGEVDPKHSAFNLLLGNLKNFPLYGQIGYLSPPFHSNVSMLLPTTQLFGYQTASPESILGALIGFDFSILQHHFTGTVFHGQDDRGIAGEWTWSRLDKYVKAGGTYQSYYETAQNSHIANEYRRKSWFIHAKRRSIQIILEKINAFGTHSTRFEMAKHYNPYRTPISLVCCYEIGSDSKIKNTPYLMVNQMTVGLNIQSILSFHVIAGIRVNVEKMLGMKAIRENPNPETWTPLITLRYVR